FDAILEHRDAEGATGGENVRLRLQRLVDAGLVDALTDLLLHPDAPAATTAAEALVAVALHLRDAVAVEHSKDAARLVVHVIVATDVAGVVIGQLAAIKTFGQGNFIVGQKFFDEDGMMNNIVVAADLWVLVLDRVEAVWTGRDDGAMLCRDGGAAIAGSVPIVTVAQRGEIKAVVVQRLNILLSLHLPQVLVADATSWIARAGLLGTEDGEIDVGRLQDLRHRGCDLLVAAVERTHAANPVEHIGIRILRHQGNAQVSGPFGAFVVADLPGVAVAFNIIEERGDLLREFALLHHQMAAHINNLRHMLDRDGTDVHASHAGGAGPEGVVGDNAADHRLMMRLPLACILIGFNPGNPKLAIERLLAQDLIAMDEECLFNAQDNLFGEEWLARVGRGTDGIAASTLGTGVAIEQLLPGELLSLRDAVIFAILDILQQR